MDIIVCVKHVPDTAEADLKIGETGKGISTADLVFDLNEWDDYAAEEAVLIKERLGGTVTVITVGSEVSNETLWKCLAKGADRAIRLTDKAFEGSDAYATAKILHRAVQKLPFDLILTGAMASDDGYGMVGVVLAELLGVPHAALVKKIEAEGGKATVNCELEDGLESVFDVSLPAVFTIQTGINEPRYVSISRIRRAMRQEIEVLGLSDLGLSEEEVGESGSWLRVERVFIPPAEKEVVFLEGEIDETTARVAEILRERGLV